MNRLLIIIVFLLTGPLTRAQVIGDLLEDESVLYAETKQVNQFFRRFNSEEDGQGKKIYKGDPGFRDNHLRKQTLPLIFDKESNSISKSIQEDFIKEVCDKNNPVFIDFHGGDWFAEVVIDVTFNGSIKEAHLFLKLEEEEVGSKWVLSKVFFEPFARLFFKNPSAIDKFLHPMSHELDFMNLVKVFREESQVEYYAYDNFVPDYLSIFIYEMKMKHLQFNGVKKVNFHFFQVDGYYFKLEEFNRSGFNNGWLITQLDEVNEASKNSLIGTIYYEGN
jgi:hypothetical protein